MRRRVITISIVIASIILTGGAVACAKAGPESTSSVTASDDPSLYAKVVNLPDGRKVICVIFDGSGPSGIGLSCDWEKAS